MARERMITRTVKVTTALVIGVNLETESVVREPVDIFGEFTNEAELVKAVKKAYDNEKFKFVSILKTAVAEALYGMSEQKFIENAEILPPRKNYNEE